MSYKPYIPMSIASADAFSEANLMRESSATIVEADAVKVEPDTVKLPPIVTFPENVCPLNAPLESSLTPIAFADTSELPTALPAILAAVTAFAAIFAVVTFASNIFAVITESAARCIASILPVTNSAVSTEFAASSEAPTAPAAICDASITSVPILPAVIALVAI